MYRNRKKGEIKYNNILKRYKGTKKGEEDSDKETNDKALAFLVFYHSILLKFNNKYTLKRQT